MLLNEFNPSSVSRAEFLRLMAGAAVAAGAGAVPAAGADPAAGPVLTRPIPRSKEPLPMIGLGTWQTFDVGTTAAARTPLTEVLRTLFAGGGKVIDSSPMYGRAEGVVGDLLAEMNARDRAFLATKVWTSGKSEGIRQMEESFRLFRAERIDLMQVHNLLDWRTHMTTLRQWKENGRIRYIGLTHYTASALDDLAAALAAEPAVDFVQINYSLNEREAEKRLLPLAAERSIAVIVNRPFAGGRGLGATRGKTLPPWAAEFDCRSWAQFFLKFVVSHPAVTCAIPGTAKPAHMADNLGAGRGRMPDAAMRARMAAHIEKAI